MSKETLKRNISVQERDSIIWSTLGSFLLLATILFAFDFVPEVTIDSATAPVTQTVPAMVGEVVATTTEVGISINDIQKNPELNVPVRIKIDRIGLDSTILTPASADIDVLDRALLSGAVHYPGSGLLGENANMLLFGHSSYLPVVHNKAFKAFNELGTLKKGDIVIVFSESHKFTYVVDNVLLSDAEDVLVRFDSPKPMLTLATCNTFGAKEERWIVTATLLSKEIW